MPDTGYFPLPQSVLPALHPLVLLHSFSISFCISCELGFFVYLRRQMQSREVVQSSKKLGQAWVCDVGSGVFI